MDQVVLVGAKRTPFGTFGGHLKNITATQLGVHAARATLAQSGIPASEIDHVIFGNVIQSCNDSAYLARHIGLLSGVPESTPALTLNRLCGSGFEAVAEAVRLIRLGEAKAVLAGGTENMSEAPYVLRGARFGYRLNDQDLEDTLLAGLRDSYPNVMMAETAEILAQENAITREQCDAYALRSQTEANRAANDGSFAEEIAPLLVKEKKQEVKITQDEGLRPNTDLTKLANLKPVFTKEGVVTAGNASGISDGAAAIVVTTKNNADKKGLTILAEWIDSHVVGCDPRRMGLGPVEAVQALLKKTDLSLNNIKMIEINEAFAAQYLTVEKLLNLDRNKTNIDGGAIALGHPLAATGSRILSHLIYKTRELGGGYALGSACIGGGQGIATLIKV